MLGFLLLEFTGVRRIMERASASVMNKGTTIADGLTAYFNVRIAACHLLAQSYLKVARLSRAVCNWFVSVDIFRAEFSR